MAIQFLHDINLNYNELQNVKIHVTSSTPSTGKGVIYFDDSSGQQKLKYHDGSNWQTLTTDTTIPVRTVSIDTNGDGTVNNTLAASETLVLKKGSNITLSESGGVVTIESADTNTQRAAGTGLSLSSNTLNVNVGATGTTQDPQSITTTANRLYQIETDNDDNLVVNVPWVDTDNNTQLSNAGVIAAIVASTSISGSDKTTIRGNIGAGTSSLTLGTTSTTALAGNTTTISSSQASAITANTAKVTFPGFGTSSGTALEGDTTVDDVSAANLKTALQAGFGSNAVNIGDSNDTITIPGNLTVSGTTTTINTETVTIQDNIIQLNSNSANTPTENAGLEVERGNSTNVRFLWDESNDRWTPFGGDSYGTKGDVGVGTLYADTLNVTDYGLTASDIPNIGAGKITSGTLPVSRGGTNVTSFADKSVIVSQDSGTDTLAAKAMSSNGQLLIGGDSGPEVATLTAGSNITITNADGGITIASAVSSSDIQTQIGANVSAIEITGDDSGTSFNVAHGLTISNLWEVSVQVVDTLSSSDTYGQTVYVGVDRTSTSQVVVTFGSAPADGHTYRVLCHKVN